MLQLIQEINKTVFVSWYRWMFGGQVSMYFGDAFVKIWNEGMGEDFVALRKMYPDYEIWLLLPVFYSKKFKAEYSFRVTHYRDIVPHIPMGKSGGYHHHRRERGMKSDEFRVCEGNESSDCSNGLYFTNSIKDHTHYFGKQVSEYGISGCV
ncbi:hypothetical protein ANCDUO_03906 [Ancylostoma duodenale]|uniref:Uncharacterized protein n=1 Tax=Ancylostoma duodenale TaxID=51022 RepID=A0A0C2GW67_9BILA|nr:hypothetical protein ANCDUO_03906 [Ancylostoma duodenale]